ncbi:MAG: ROK family protein [Proteobacteria bacterium]|nr:ROK family protein [Pseudomonadota bacterium]
MRIGIDLGGSKIEGLVLGPDGEELARARVQTPQGDYGATVAAVAGLVAELVQEAGADDGGPVGVGIPGAISPATGRVKNANSTCLIGHAFDRDLEEAMGRPVRLANDADCFTISEATDGAGENVNVVFGVILGGIAFDAAADLTPFRWYITVLGFLAIPPMLMVIRQIRAQRELEPAAALSGD